MFLITNQGPLIATWWRHKQSVWAEEVSDAGTGRGRPAGFRLGEELDRKRADEETGKWELVRLELWLNSSLRRSLDGKRRSGTTPRAWHQTDSKTWYLIFLSRTDTSSALYLVFSHACSERRSCSTPPDVHAVPSLLIQIICRLFSWRRIKTFPLSQLFVFDWNKSLTHECLHITP